MIENTEFPFILYTANFDYEFPIPHKVWIKDQKTLDFELEECELYGYFVITQEEYDVFWKLYVNPV